MLYPEQPIGTGFSYGTYPKDERDVAADLWQFMQNFMMSYPVGRYFYEQNEKL